MDYIYALILGLTEGVTEFLPVSSTAHLIITAKVLGLPQSEYWKFFEVFVQSGAILAVIVVFLNKIWNKKLITNLMFSFVPTAVVGLALHQVIKNIFFENTFIIAGALALFSFMFLWLERQVLTKKLILKKNMEDLTWKEAVKVGLWQSLAVVPGVSRAGAVLVGSMMMGYKRTEAALYSFLLAVPTIFAASVLDLLKTDRNILLQQSGVSLVGLLVAFASAYMVVRWLIKYLQHHTLVTFAYYRLALALLVALFALAS